MYEDRWVKERIGSLVPIEDWEPNAIQGLERLRDRGTRAERRRIWLVAVATAVAACICVTGLPRLREGSWRAGNVSLFSENRDAAWAAGKTAGLTEKSSGNGLRVENALEETKAGEIATVTEGVLTLGGAQERTLSKLPAVRIENITSDIMANVTDIAAPEAGAAVFLNLLSTQEAANQGNAGDDLSSTPLDVAPPPYDPIEPITSPPAAVVSTQARREVIALLAQALQTRAFYEPTLLPPSTYLAGMPYTVRVSFVASGAARDVGAGQMEETRNAAGVRRWTSSLAGFSLTRIMSDQFYDAGSRGPIPMRLQMIREIVLGNLGGSPPEYTRDSVRTATATLNGSLLSCILISPKSNVAPIRDWSEREYCIDSQSKLLRVYSAAPGIYVVFDYDQASDFHGHIAPRRFTVTESGKVVLQGVIHVQDPDPKHLEPLLFTPTKSMATSGLGLLWPVGHIQTGAKTVRSNSLQPVIVHATLSPDGRVVEAEALQTLDQQLSESALDLVRKTRYDSTFDYGHPPQQEIFVTVE